MLEGGNHVYDGEKDFFLLEQFEWVLGGGTFY